MITAMTTNAVAISKVILRPSFLKETRNPNAIPMRAMIGTRTGMVMFIIFSFCIGVLFYSRIRLTSSMSPPRAAQPNSFRNALARFLGFKANKQALRIRISISVFFID